MTPQQAPWTAGLWRVVGPDPKGKNPNLGLWAVDGTSNVANDCTLADATLISAAPQMAEALAPFAAYERIRQTMGGTTTRDGVIWNVESRAGRAEITVEDMQRAIAALTAAGARP